MIPLTVLYDEYIDRPKSTEQKNPFDYLVPPPTSGVGTIKRTPQKNTDSIDNFIAQQVILPLASSYTETGPKMAITEIATQLITDTIRYLQKIRRTEVGGGGGGWLNIFREKEKTKKMCNPIGA